MLVCWSGINEGFPPAKLLALPMEALISSMVFHPPFTVRFPPKEPPFLEGGRSPLQEGEQPARSLFKWQEGAIVPLTDDVTEDVWHVLRVPCVVLTHEAPRCAALYFHGNAENLASEGTLQFAARLGEALHASVYIIEYPGTWGSPGRGGTTKPLCKSPQRVRGLAPPLAGYWLPTSADVRPPPKPSQGPSCPHLQIAVGSSLGSWPELHVRTRAQPACMLPVCLRPRG